jgi:RNA polymerase II subunit A small phosphatase-like protein
VLVEPPTKLLILDLDETLVYATTERLGRSPHFEVGPYFVYRRPHLDQFLDLCKEHFKIAVWSSSSALYCQGIVDAIFGEAARLDFVWASDRCSHVFDYESGERYWRKNIRKVKRLGYPLESIIAVDDTLQKWEKSYGSLVLVREFLGDPADAELEYLERYLTVLMNEEDIRAVDKLGWRRKLEALDNQAKEA